MSGDDRVNHELVDMMTSSIRHGTQSSAHLGPANWVQYLPLLLVLVLRVASEPTANLSYLVVAVYALFGRPHLIRALVMSWLLTLLSPGLAPDPQFDTVGRYAVLFAAALSAFVQGHFVRGPRRRDRLVGMTILLGVFIVVHAVLFSPMVDVSVLKGVSWTVAMATCISAWSGLSPFERREMANELYWGLVVVLVVSLPLAATPVGYLRNGTGFQGILNQPQAFGPTMALLFAWSAGKLLGDHRFTWWTAGIATVSLVTVYLSEARTGGLAAVLGIFVAIFLAPALARRPMGDVAPGLRNPWIWAAMAVMVLGALILGTVFSSLLEHFITKSGRAGVDGLFDAYQTSRGRLIDPMMANIAAQPWTGIGFGIDSVPELMSVSRDPFLGLPVGAATEKGNTPLMVLEELGILGALLVGWWALRLVRSAATGGVASLGMVLTVLFINLGEASMFSPGGFGLLQIVILAYANAAGRVETRRRSG